MIEIGLPLATHLLMDQHKESSFYFAQWDDLTLLFDQLSNIRESVKSH
jgi:hypothetical protein